MSTLRTLTRNISWNYLQTVVRLIIYFLLTPFVVEALGVVGYGLWILLNAILFYLKFLDLGFYSSLVKYVAEYAEREDWETINGLISTTLAALTAAGVTALIGSVAVAFWVVPHVFQVPAENIAELQHATLLVGVNLVIGFPSSGLSAVLEGRQRFDALSGISIFVMIAGASATLLALSSGYGVVALVWIAIGSTLLTTAATWALLRRWYPELNLGVLELFRGASRSHFRRIRSYSAWTSLNEILTEGGAELEKLLVPILLGVSLLTPYTLIVTVAASIFLVIQPITDAFFPMSSAFEAGADKRQLSELLERGTKLVVGLSLPFAVAIAFYGREFILLWIGADNVELPTGVTPLVAASYWVTAFTMTGITILLALARVREVFWMGIVELVIAMALVLATVPKMGLQGLAASLLVSNLAVTFAWITPHVCRLLGQSVVGFLGAAIFRPALSALPLVAVLIWSERLNPGATLSAIALNCVISGAVYVAAFHILSLSSRERASIYGTLRQLVLKKAE